MTSRVDIKALPADRPHAPTTGAAAQIWDARKTGFVALLTAAVTIIAAMTFTVGQAQARPAPDNFSDLAEKLLPSVVNISTTQVVEGRSQGLPQFPPGHPLEEFFQDFFDRQDQGRRSRRATSLGSGFIIDEAGHIVTNNHVIQDADEITVILHDNTRLEAKIIGRDQKTDLAVLKVEPEGRKLPVVGFGNSEKARVGEWVVAIGNPFGLGGTVTAGIISARGRDINSGPYDNFIQTDASINRGNSGGPLFNMNGEVIGINTVIFSPSGGSVGIGFSIPTSTAEPIIRQLIDDGTVKRGWLGVHIQSVTPELAETLGLGKPRGALVNKVFEDGPADKAEFKHGDVILKFNNRKVPEMRKLPRIVAETQVGASVPVEIWRDGKKVTLQVKLGELQDDETQVTARTDAPKKSKPTTADVESLGLTLAEITDEAKEEFKLAGDAKGVLVTKVDGDGPAAEHGLRPGDLIIEVSQEEVDTPDQVAAKVNEARQSGRKSVLVLIRGQNGIRFVPIRIGDS